jgi:hypothetical protein
MSNGRIEQHYRAKERVEDEDVADPEQIGVDEPNHQQDAHAAQKERDEACAVFLRAAILDRQPEAKQKREDRVELALGQKRDAPARKAIQCRGRVTEVQRRRVDRVVEQRHIHQQNAEDRKAAQDIDGLDALARRDRRNNGLCRSIHGRPLARRVPARSDARAQQVTAVHARSSEHHRL